MKHTHNSSAFAVGLSVFDHFVGFAFKGLICESLLTLKGIIANLHDQF